MLNFEEYHGRRVTINEFIKELRYRYWKELFTNKLFTENLTSNLRNQLYSKLQQLKDYDFSVYNIMTIKQEIMENTIKGVEQTILDLFEEFSVKYSYYDETSKNIHYYNGWKTNKAYKINKKIIMPYNMFEYYRWSKEYCFRNHAIGSKFIDIIKVMDYLSGQKTDITEDTFTNYIGEYELDIPYFTIRFYKKGTTHITFKDDDLLEKFNLYGSQKKGWLPPIYGKKKYSDMTNEEKTLVKEFSGTEENYNKIYNNQNYYILDMAQTLQIDYNN